MNSLNMYELSVNTPKLVMLYGSPGSGKTSIAISGTHRKLLVDLERGASRAIANKYTDVWIPQSLAEFMNELNHEAVKCYDVIVIDTLGRLVELLVKKHSNASGIANQNTWSSIRRDLLNWWQSLLKLNKHIVLIAHGKQDGDTYRPEVLGNSPALILRDLDYVGVVKARTVMFNLPNSWCKNTHSKMADEAHIDVSTDGIFLEMLLASSDTVAINDDVHGKAGDAMAICYDKTIANISNITQLNSTYKFLINNARDDSWKKRLMDKCSTLNAKFNQEAKLFETISAV